MGIDWTSDRMFCLHSSQWYLNGPDNFLKLFAVTPGYQTIPVFRKTNDKVKVTESGFP